MKSLYETRYRKEEIGSFTVQVQCSDAGAYMCDNDEDNEHTCISQPIELERDMNFHGLGKPIVILVMQLFLILLADCTGSIVQKPIDTEVHLGGSTYLNCSTSNPSETINWYHYPVGKSTADQKYVYAYGQMYPPYDHRFRIEMSNVTGSSNLIISLVERDDAGLYICQNGGDTGYTAQLIVLDSTSICDSNIQQEGFIGPNSCGLQEDSIQLSCRIKYFGNIPPRLNWKQLLANKTSISMDDEVSNCRIMSDAVWCNMTIHTDVYMDGSRLVCQSNRSRNVQDYIVSDTIQVKYAFSYKIQAEKTLGSEIVCSADTNSAFCNYTWIWFDGVNEKVISDEAKMKVKISGWHRCESNCQLKNASCKFKAMLIQAMNEDGGKTNVYTIPGIAAVAAVVVSILIVAVIVPVCMQLKKRRRRNEITKSQEKTLIE